MLTPLVFHPPVRPAAPRLRGLAGLTLALLLATAAQARLGGNLASVHSDAQAMGASTSQTVVAGATVYSLLLANGLTVRQYVDASGQVFAVAWDGPVLPDFARLLGPHFAAYQHSQRQQQRGVSIRSADLVLESGGMMRAFGGRAYLPAQVPATLSLQDIR